MNKYLVSSKDTTRKIIHKELDRYIRKIQNKLQMKENLKYGRKAKTISYKFASREVLKNVR
jgi:hypothetical protein